MRLGRIVLAALGMSAVFAEPALRMEEFNHIASKNQKKEEKTKHNKVSQAKRRKYKRQGRL